MKNVISVKGTDYQILKLLGHGKGGYSYLALSCDRRVVLKQIHHEPCNYYTFGNKIESEKNDYIRLKEAGIRIPASIAMIAMTTRSSIRVKQCFTLFFGEDTFFIISFLFFMGG